MKPEMFILTAIDKNDETTRFVVGCSAQSEEVEQALVSRGYDVGVGFGEVPDRPEEERTRASRILAAIFGN